MNLFNWSSSAKSINRGFAIDTADYFGLGTTRRQQEFNASEAQKQRDWQTYMSNTAHQREVSDLQAAGLNPILSVTGGMGGGASSIPSGSSGQGSMSAKSNNSMKDLTKFVTKIIATTAKSMH